MNRYSIAHKLQCLTQALSFILKDMLTLRCLFLKQLFKSRRRLKITILFIFVLITLYVFGVFTHLFEKNLSQFKSPLNQSIQQSLLDLKPGQHIDQVPDINNLDYEFIHNARNSCAPVHRQIDGDLLKAEPYLVILVKSKLSNFEEREVIRRTWAHRDELRLIRTVFLIGSLQGSDDLLLKIEVENDRYQDIVQQKFVDNYYNNTLKTMMGIKWINRYCENSKYYMFIDDDFYLNPNQLIKYLKNDVTTHMYDTFYGGYVFPSSNPMRHMVSKWYTTLEEYPYSKFPPFIAAGCYILSRPSARLFYMASKLIKLFRFDDIYMAILAHNIGIRPMSIEGIKYYAPTYEPGLYGFDLIAAHDFGCDELMSIWNELRTVIEFKSSGRVYKNYLHEVISKD